MGRSGVRADFSRRRLHHAIFDPHPLWSVGEQAEDPADDSVICVHPHQLLHYQVGLDRVEDTGEVKE